jgi:hypothetical protein
MLLQCVELACRYLIPLISHHSWLNIHAPRHTNQRWGISDRSKGTQHREANILRLAVLCHLGVRVLIRNGELFAIEAGSERN